ncbi:MAG: hypothetical protein RLZZ50_782 [Verrucomicrobiota bacterium]|jgi:hypothetical protein
MRSRGGPRFFVRLQGVAALAEAAKKGNFVGRHFPPGLGKRAAKPFALARGDAGEGVGLSPQHFEGGAFARQVKGDQRV